MSDMTADQLAKLPPLTVEPDRVIMTGGDGLAEDVIFDLLDFAEDDEAEAYHADFLDKFEPLPQRHIMGDPELLRSLLEVVASIPAMARTALAEAEHGITLIEGAKSDKFETELRMLTGSDQQRDDIRHGAIMIAQMGYPAEEMERAFRMYFRAQALNITTDDLLELARSRMTPEDLEEVERFRDTLR